MHKEQLIQWPDLTVTASVRSFRPENGVAEHHAVIETKNRQLSAEEQFQAVETAAEHLQYLFPGCTPLFRRYFVSDAANQQHFLKNGNGCVSVVQQPPLNGSKVCLWIYLAEGGDSSHSAGSCVWRHAGYSHIRHSGLQVPGADEFRATDTIFDRYARELAGYGCSLADHCIRTWIYVQGVDIHYAGMVRARKAFFEKEGLTPATHFIASTGIEGKAVDPRSLVLMDAYAIHGISPEQIRYLQAPAHLNPTYEYGVTFERGTAVDYGDRRHVFISGTASIDNKGEIVHPQEIAGQTERMFENIGALLKEAECSLEDVMQMIVYLRDTADAEKVGEYLEKSCSGIPYVLVWAPVCRPGWLVEAECMAVKAGKNTKFAPF
ncbi:MAG: hypothetical protein LBR65_10155 [Culturomica sp.]|jgi:enamine deaminase RidA (YjgF/YER057c/UK114 family)|nr:hypothetical protein [Culturomica sp.]